MIDQRIREITKYEFKGRTYDSVEEAERAIGISEFTAWVGERLHAHAELEEFLEDLEKNFEGYISRLQKLY